MNLISLVGRVLLVLVFIVSGAFKLLDINAAAEDIRTAVTLPSIVLPYMKQLEAATSMTTPQILAIAAGLVELICGIMVIFNIGARWFALVLVAFVAVTTFYVHDFWNPVTAERLSKLTGLGPAQVEHYNNILQALKNLSLIGALLLIVGRERVEPSTEPAYEHDIMRH